MTPIPAPVPDALRVGLLHAARNAFTDLVGPARSARHCGYALYSDAAATSVGCAVNTRAHLARAQATDPEDAEYYRWTPGEWALEGFGHEHFADLNRRLLDLSSGARSSELTTRRGDVFEACVATLEALLAEGVLVPAPDTVVVFAVSDHEDPARESEWIRRLNPPSLARRFALWLQDAEARA
ncbi:DUF4303 domain-containing protein [Nonomuraea pusilla]|uniref:DUF4303 domain-containing protein n=1 Tax=Nonomuraea pusilla TaxID=46177 RepID=A0A1H7GW24_9ACTN|nr:DUF4303 domain-containing protein [Nonomuraea pusilla]SEK42373.1 protein of unknown function [Nonomuraea pusilla]